MSRERELREARTQMTALSHAMRGLASAMEQFGPVIVGVSDQLETLSGVLELITPKASKLDATSPLRHNHMARGVYGGCPACFTRNLVVDTPQDGG